MPRYQCPSCKTTSDEVKTQAEARELLKTHLAYFCTSRGPARRRPTRTIR